MTDQDRELFEKALDMLMDAQLHNYALKHKETDDLITAMRDRLAQPEQEPVAWLVQYSNKHEFVWGQKPQWIADAIGIEPLYTAPQRREWVGLTRDEVLDIEETAKHPLDFARSIEAKLKERNT